MFLQGYRKMEQQFRLTARLMDYLTRRDNQPGVEGSAAVKDAGAV